MDRTYFVKAYQGDDVGWNKIIERFPDVSVFHTSQWAHYWKEHRNQGCIRCIIYDKMQDAVFGVCLVFVQPPFVAYWFHGPLILLPPSAKFSPADITIALLNYLKRRGFFVLGISSFPVGLTIPVNQRAMITKAGYVLTEWGTYMIDFEGKTEDDIWLSLDRSVHKNVRKCEHEHVEVIRLQSVSEIEELYLPVLREHRERLGFPLPPAYPDATLWEWLRTPGCVLEVFLAHRHSVPLAGLGIFGYKGIVSELAVAQSSLTFSEKIPAQDLIKWEIIKWGVTNGIHKYDLSGVSPKPANEKEENIRRYKKKFGGDYYNFWQISSRKPRLISWIANLLRDSSHLDKPQ